MDEFQQSVEYVQTFINTEIVSVRGQKYARLDNRNHLLVYSQVTCPPRFVEIVTKYPSVSITFPDGHGNPLPYAIVSEKQWAEMDLGKVRPDISEAFYDEEYYRPSLKNECYIDYTWELQSHLWIERAGQIIDVFGPSSLLDIGCAKGFLLKAMSLRGVAGQGVDISQWAVDHCEPEVSGKLRQFDLTGGGPLPFTDGSFDVVHSDMTMEHIDAEFIPHCLTEMYRVSRKWVLLGVPLGPSKDSRPYGDVSHKSIFCPSWWISKAHEAGLLFDWRYSKFFAARTNPEFIGESVRFVFVKDKLDSDCPWDRLGIKVDIL